MSNELLSTNEAAAVLNVGASTVKRWADEGRLACVKTAGGHRRFHRNAVAELLGQSMPSDAEIHSKQILDDSDGHAVLALLYQMRSRYGAWWVVAERIGTFLNEVGEDWAVGKLSIVEEHTISERLTRAISSVCQILPAATDAPVCLFVMVEGDDHTLGLRLAELVAKETGWKSRWVGRQTPLEELSDVIASQSVQAVAASASEYSTDENLLVRQTRTLEAMVEPAGLPLALGGDGHWPDAPSYGKRIGDFDAFRKFLISNIGRR